MQTNRIFWFHCILILALAGCSSPASSVTRTGSSPIDTPASSTPTPKDIQRETITPTYPCPQATQELPPRVDPLTSPTNLASQVVHILPGNYESATIETESGTFSASFNGPGGAQVNVTLLPNTIHHLKVTVHVRRSTSFGGCSYGGYDMSVSSDRTGQPLEIIQGVPPTLAPVSQPISPQTIGSLRQLARISLPDKQRPWSVTFAPQELLYSFGFGQGVRKWQLPSGQAAGSLLLNETGMTTALDLSGDNAWMAAGSGGSDPSDANQTGVRLWNLKTGQTRLLGHHPASVEVVAFNPSGTLLASGGNDNTVIIWETDSGEEIVKMKGDVVTLADGSHLIQGMRKLIWADDSTLFGRADAVIYQWKVPSGERVREISGGYQDMDFSRPAGRLAVVRADGVYLQDSSSGDFIPLLEGDQKSLNFLQVVFNPDGTLLAAVGETKISFWDSRSNKFLGTGRNPAGLPLEFSPDWRYLARVSWTDQYVSLWGVQP